MFKILMFYCLFLFISILISIWFGCCFYFSPMLHVQACMHKPANAIPVAIYLKLHVLNASASSSVDGIAWMLWMEFLLRNWINTKEVESSVAKLKFWNRRNGKKQLIRNVTNCNSPRLATSMERNVTFV